jgi:hypothetical protein
MENRKIPALIALAGIIIAIVVFFAFGDDDTSENATDTPEPTQSATPEPGDDEETPEKPGRAAEEEEPIEIEIEDGEPQRGVREIEVTEGDELRISVTTDAADELHLHGYELYFDIIPGKKNDVIVESADIGGVFELESHSTGALIAEISVVPD